MLDPEPLRLQRDLVERRFVVNLNSDRHRLGRAIQVFYEPNANAARIGRLFIAAQSGRKPLDFEPDSQAPQARAPQRIPAFEAVLSRLRPLLLHSQTASSSRMAVMTRR